MRRLLQMAVAISALSFGSATLMAQLNTGEEAPPANTDTQSGTFITTEPDDQTSVGVGSRALGEYKTEVDPGEARNAEGELDIRRLDAQGRGGQEN
jgi:hypothetical protein